MPKDGDFKDYILQALRATMYKSIEYENNIEDFVGCTQNKLLIIIVEDFGGIGFHNDFWVHYDRFNKCVQFTFSFGLYIIM